MIDGPQLKHTLGMIDHSDLLEEVFLLITLLASIKAEDE